MLSDAPLGRSHRAAPGKAKLKAAIDQTRDILGVPADYRIGIVPASDTGAVEMAMWSMLGPRPVDMLAWESFGAGWVTDVVKQLKLDATVRKAALRRDRRIWPHVDFDRDVVFTWNGTTSGVRVPTATGFRPTAQGLTICDATSAAFAHGPALGQARCRDLVLAEGAGRRGGARDAGPVARARSSGSKATRRPGRCRRSFA